MAPGQLGEVDPSKVEIVEIAVVELVQLVQRPLVADPLAGPEHQLAEDAFVRIPRVTEQGRKVGKDEGSTWKVSFRELAARRRQRRASAGLLCGGRRKAYPAGTR